MVRNNLVPSHKKKVELDLYRQALETGNASALSALNFLLLGKHSEEISKLRSLGQD